MRTDSTILRLSWVVCIAMSIGLAGGCDRSITPAPTGQEVFTWKTPYDNEAAAAAMPYYRTADLTDYTFSLLLIVQNYTGAGAAVTLEVNGQSFERRYIASHTQEVFEITPAMVLESEATLGLSSTAAEPRLGGRPCPFLVRLKQYISEDQYVFQNTDLLLAPTNYFESMSKPDVVPDTGYLVDGHHVCPGTFALVIHETHVDVLELDREFLGINEADDDTDNAYTPLGDETDPQYHAETLQTLDMLGLDWLLTGQ